MNEKKIIKKARKGDQEAFGQLYDKYISGIYRFVFFRINDKSETEDLTQQVFLKAWQNVSSFKIKKEAKFSSWLYRIAKNLIIDYYRTAKDHINIDDIKYDQQFAISYKLEEKIDNLTKFKQVKKSLTILTEDEQDVIIMKFVEEFSNEEIAQALDKSRGAVRVTQHRALKKIKCFFQESESKNK